MDIKARLNRIEKRRGRRKECARLADEQFERQFLELAGKLKTTVWRTEDNGEQVEKARLLIPQGTGK